MSMIPARQGRGEVVRLLITIWRWRTEGPGERDGESERTSEGVDEVEGVCGYWVDGRGRTIEIVHAIRIPCESFRTLLVDDTDDELVVIE